MTKLYQPVVGRNASICHWSLSFSFYTKEQCERFISEYMKEAILVNFNYRVEIGDGSKPYQYVVDIDDMSWANNLTRVAKILEKIDYQDEELHGCYEDHDFYE
jgi:hypothetical protein